MRLVDFYRNFEVFDEFEQVKVDDEGKQSPVEQVAGAEEVVDGAFEFVEVFVHGSRGSWW